MLIFLCLTVLNLAFCVNGGYLILKGPGTISRRGELYATVRWSSTLWKKPDQETNQHASSLPLCGIVPLFHSWTRSEIEVTLSRQKGCNSIPRRQFVILIIWEHIDRNDRSKVGLGVIALWNKIFYLIINVFTQTVIVQFYGIDFTSKKINLHKFYGVKITCSWNQHDCLINIYRAGL